MIRLWAPCFSKLFIDYDPKTQSARGENQQRPGSGYGAPGGQPGPSSGSAGTGPPAPSVSGAYHPQGESVNSILSPHGLEGGEAENAPYGQVYPPGSGNNGVGHEPY